MSNEEQKFTNITQLTTSYFGLGGQNRQHNGDNFRKWQHMKEQRSVQVK